MTTPTIEGEMNGEFKIKWAEIVRINHDVPAIQAADAELTRLRKELEEKEEQLCGARDVLRKIVFAVKQEPAMQNMKYDALGAEALDVLFRSAPCPHEARLRDWERSSAESGTVLIRSERYNELLAVEARAKGEDEPKRSP